MSTEEKENTEEMRQAQAYLESVGGGPHTIGKELSVSCYHCMLLLVLHQMSLLIKI